MNINASRCVAYLRAVGVEISGETAAAWQQQEKDHRAQNRSHCRELKKSCGHFRTHDTKIHHGSSITTVRYCSDCHKPVRYFGDSL